MVPSKVAVVLSVVMITVVYVHGQSSSMIKMLSPSPSLSRSSSLPRESSPRDGRPPPSISPSSPPPGQSSPRDGRPPPSIPPSSPPPGQSSPRDGRPPPSIPPSSPPPGQSSPRDGRPPPSIPPSSPPPGQSSPRNGRPPPSISPSSPPPGQSSPRDGRPPPSISPSSQPPRQSSPRDGRPPPSISPSSPPPGQSPPRDGHPPPSISPSSPPPMRSSPPPPSPSSTTSSTEPSSTPVPTNAGAVNGNWTEWGDWKCSVGCGNGTKTRNRTCTNPPPSGGGAVCSGEGSMKDRCDNKPCAKIVLKVAITIISLEWKNTLSDSNSSDYKSAEANIIDWGKRLENVESVENISFVQGSVIANFDLVFGAPSSSSASAEQPDYTSAINTAISDGKIGNLTVDKSSLKTEESVSGVKLGDWKTDFNMCATVCHGCDAWLATIFKNRTCEAIISSCSGLKTAKEITCGDSGCDKSHCGGVTVQISAITMMLGVLLSLRFLYCSEVLTIE